MRDDPHFFPVVPHRRQWEFWKIDRLFVVADRLARNVENPARGAVGKGERPQQLAMGSVRTLRKTTQEQGEAAKRCAAEAVNGLTMVADHKQVRPFAAEQPEQFQLRDIGVLEFVDEDIPEARAKRITQRLVTPQSRDCIEDLSSERD